MMGNFLAKLAGAQEAVLQRCPSERTRFQGLGSAILITSCIAAVSMWFALASALGINPVLAFLVAILWGLIILGIDRWLVTSIPPEGGRRWGIALPRLLLAILLGTLISTPIVLRVFQSEINNQIALIHQQRANQFLASEQNSTVSQQVTHWSAQVSDLEKVINSGGAVPLNPAADPDVQSLTSQLNKETTLEQKYYQQWQCQLYGGQPGCPKGDGPLAQASYNSYLHAKQQVSSIQSQITAREQVLSASDQASEHTRLAQALAALPSAQAELASATAQENDLRNSYESSNLAANGLLIRLQALNQLSSGDFTVNFTRFLLFLFFLVIECLPVSVKLLQRPGVYEDILAAMAQRELRDARWAIRAGGGAPEAGRFADPVLAPVTPERALAVTRELWSRQLPAAPDWPSTAVTEPTMDLGEATGSRSQMDAAIRAMPDVRAASEETEEQEPRLRYDHDDL
jgi:hypothetical protein